MSDWVKRTARTYGDDYYFKETELLTGCIAKSRFSHDHSIMIGDKKTGKHYLLISRGESLEDAKNMFDAQTPESLEAGLKRTDSWTLLLKGNPDE